MPIVNYFLQREQEATSRGLYAERSGEPAWAVATDDTGGRYYCRYFFDAYNIGTLVNVHEVVELRGSGVHRVKYSYRLVINGDCVRGFDRDPSHRGYEVHEHKDGETIRDTPPVSFVAAIDEFWRIASDHPGVRPALPARRD